ncbi:E3 ubiquitin-protein ligase TRIM71-like [Anneissia japonica]|uniref:E3 ubiquitin-protein ligase TRIM71-like n=1 Tax=Anneissia japonica TaxID=1529436 RepID=UPI0014259B40|nr:E3 ubiquitin-protein ligase TRIM71-like [Anneissia japonica]
MKKKGKLECPNCRQSHPIPEGGLQTLPSYAMEFKTARHLDRLSNNIKCYCGKYNADFYCKDCSQYLCTSCTNTHDQILALKNHTPQPIKARSPSTEIPHNNLCPLHEKELEFYCKVCKTPICQKCAIIDHSEYDGQHQPIRASDAFNDLRITANALTAQADFHKYLAQAGISKCIANASELSKRRNDIMKNINKTAEEMIKLVRETEISLVAKLEDICKAKNRKGNSQIDELKSIISDIEGKQSYIATLLKSGNATALNTCQQVIRELQDNVGVPPETEPRDDGKVYFSPTKDHIPVLTSLKKLGIGHVSEKPNENIFKIVPENPMTVTCYQPFHVEIAQKYECEIDMNDLTISKSEMAASCTSSKNTPTFRIVKSEGKYLIKGTTTTDVTLDVKFHNSSIKGSPIKIIVKPVEIKKITFCKDNGQEIKSIFTGLEVTSLPSGISVDEDLNVVYVSDEIANCVVFITWRAMLRLKPLDLKAVLKDK